MDTESSGKVNFDEFRAFCNAVVIEAEEIALSGRPSVDENGEDILQTKTREGTPEHEDQTGPTKVAATAYALSRPLLH